MADSTTGPVLRSISPEATPEDEMNVRWWAGDEALSPPEAAAVVIRRELERDHAAGSLTAVETVSPCGCVSAYAVGTGQI